MDRLRFITVMIVAGAWGCTPAGGVSAKKNDRSTKEEIQAAAETEVSSSTGTGEGAGSGTGEGSGSNVGEGSEGIQPDASLTYFQDTKQILDQYCVDCHGPTPHGGAGDDMDLSTYDNVGGKLGAYARRDRIRERVEANTMPTNQTMLPADRAKLIAWILGGATQGVDPAATAPTATFVTPAVTGEAPTSGSFVVSLEFTNTPDESYYDLFYTTTGAATGGTRFAEDVPVDDLTTPFDTSALPNGTYYFYVTLYDGEGTTLTTVASTGSVAVDNSTP